MRTFDDHTRLFYQQPDAAAGGVNSPAARTDINVEWPDEEDIGSLQMGGQRTTLLPGIDTFKLPDNLAQLWHEIEIEDTRPFLANGQPNPGKGQKVKRRQLKLDRNTPLVVVGGAHDGEPMTGTFSTNPRPRGKKDDPKTPWVSDLAMLLDVSLADKSRPKTAPELEAAINRYAGKTIRMEHGLTARCRPDKQRYILVQTQEPTGEVDPATGQPKMRIVESTMLDPAGTKGCGEAYYTKDFKNPDAKPGEAQYDTEIACDCNAVLRGFESVERFLPPLGQAVTK